MSRRSVARELPHSADAGADGSGVDLWLGDSLLVLPMTLEPRGPRPATMPATVNPLLLFDMEFQERLFALACQQCFMLGSMQPWN